MKKNKKNPEQEDVKNVEEVTDVSEDVKEDIAEEVTDNEDVDLLKIENQKLKEDYLRSLADCENIKRRCAQEIEKNSKYAIASFAKSLLSVADNLQRALDASAEKENCEALLKGVELTQAELIKVFDKFGVRKMEIIGTHFDPNFHQVVQEVEDKSKEPGTIVAELQTGYMINDRILREAMVVVSK